MEITQKKATSSDSKEDSSLNAFLSKVKANKKIEKFEEYFNDITEFWFYQYTEAFHCKPDTIEDMLMGIKYLYFKTEDR